MVEQDVMHILAVCSTSYLLGSIPTAYLIARSKGIDIFEVGSGNMGATNVGRALGFWWGILVWLFDSLKGIAAILLATLIMSENRAAAMVLAATMAIIGHNWSVFASLACGKLRGGKGAAIWFGTMLVMAPFQVIVGMMMLGGFIIAATRYVSLAVLGMLTLAMVWLLVLIGQGYPPEYALYVVSATALILYSFRENIQRLLTGTERRLGDPA